MIARASGGLVSDRESLSVEDAAGFLGASEDELRRAMDNGAFPGRFLVEDRVRVPREDLERALGRWKRRPRARSRDHAGEAGPDRRGQSPPKAELGSLENVLEQARELVTQELAAYADRLERVEEEVRQLRKELREASVSMGSHGEGVWKGGSEQASGIDAGRVVQEISDLEALLTEYEIEELS